MIAVVDSLMLLHDLSVPVVQPVHNRLYVGTAEAVAGSKAMPATKVTLRSL
jgi:hypothetical protein